MNDINNLEFSIKQVKENFKHAQAAMAYTVSPVHKLDYWLDLAKRLKIWEWILSQLKICLEF